MNAGPEIKNIVLVHGGFVDGSGWQGVYDDLTADGYRVSVVQNPTLSLAGDVAATHLILDGLDGPAVLVGHSYGGAVITEAGNHPNVSALAYITAFAPDKARIGQLAHRRLPDRRAAAADPAAQGRLPVPRPGQVRRVVRGRRRAGPGRVHGRRAGPWGVDALGGAITEPAWRSKPSWYLLVTDDRMIPPSAQRAMAERTGATVSEVPGSHAIYVSNPAAVAAVVAQAAATLALSPGCG